jgi:hypothetical protein
VQRCREEAHGFRSPATTRKSTLHGAGVLAQTVESTGERSGLATFAESAGRRPFHKRGSGCAACPRCWRSRRIAVSSSRSIEQRPTSRFICSFTPTTDMRTIPAALPSPARVVELARANAALSEIVPGDNAIDDRVHARNPWQRISAGAGPACASFWANAQVAFTLSARAFCLCNLQAMPQPPGCASFGTAALNSWMPDSHLLREAQAGSARLRPRGARLLRT